MILKPIIIVINNNEKGDHKNNDNNSNNSENTWINLNIANDYNSNGSYDKKK